MTIETTGYGSDSPWGERLRSWRKSKGWSRPDLCDQLAATSYKTREARGDRIDISRIKAWETGATKSPQPVYRRLLAQLGAPLPDTMTEEDASSGQGGDDDMQRRAFLVNAGAAVAAAVFMPGASYGGRAVPAKVDSVVIRSFRESVDQLYRNDQLVGGGTLAQTALGAYYDARHMLDESDYGEADGQSLMSIAGELAVCVGWLSYDAGNHSLARELYSEAHMLADQASDTRLAIQALEKMALQSVYVAERGQHRGSAREAVRIGARLTDLARQEGSPHLHALIGARQAVAYAISGAATEFRDSIRRSRREIDDAGSDLASEAWLQFVTAEEIAVQEARGHWFLGNAAKAEEMYRDSIASSTVSVRNRANHQANLSRVLLSAGDERGAVTEGRSALRVLEDVASRRTLQAVEQLRPIAQKQGDDEFCTRYDRVAQRLEA